MNYELLSNLYKEEAEKNKNDALILKTRNEILRHEVENLKLKIKKLEDEKTSLEKELESLKSALEFKEEKQKESFTYYS